MGLKSKKKEVHPYLVKVGEHIKQLRQEEGLSLESLGSSIGIDGSNMQKIEKGMNITISSLIRILIVLDKNPSDFFSDIEWDVSMDDIERLVIPKTAAKKKKVSKKRTSKKA